MQVTFVGWCHVSRAGFLFHRGQRQWCGARGPDRRMCPTQVGKVLSSCPSSYGPCCKGRTHTHCQQRHVAPLQVCRGLGAHPRRICMFPASVSCLRLSHACFLFHSDFADIFQCDRDAAVQSAPPAVVVRNLIKGRVLRDTGSSLHSQDREQNDVKDRNP